MNSNQLIKLFLTFVMIGSITIACEKVNINLRSWAKVRMVSPIVLGDEQEAAQITAVIEEYWSAWLQQDQMGSTALLSEDILYVSQQTSVRASSLEEVETLLNEEWRAYEKAKSGVIAMNMDISELEIEVVDGAAKVSYWIDAVGGIRWDFEDQAFVSQLFVKSGNSWDIAYHQDSWGLNYNSGDNVSLEFDYAYPVEDLNRAVQFYTPLLGEPEAVLNDRATYFIEGVRFHLYQDSLGGHAKVEEGLPSGYSFIQVADLENEKASLAGAGLSMLHEGNINTLDPFAVFADPSGNIFTLTEKVYDASATATPIVLAGFPGGELGMLADGIVQALAKMDVSSLESYLEPEVLWFDDSRDRSFGTAKNQNEILEFLTNHWQSFDRSPMGIAAEFEPSAFIEKQVGSWRVANFQLTQMGTASHLFKEKAWVSFVFDLEDKLCSGFFSRANTTEALVAEFDYTAHPVVDLSDAQSFYENNLGFGDLYTDTDWLGYYGTYMVFGVYLSDRQRDGFPRPNLANGYLSLWVESAEETYQYLQNQAVEFPIIEAINEKSGIDEQPGYTQIVATDSEGNIIVFTEYEGKGG